MKVRTAILILSTLFLVSFFFLYRNDYSTFTKFQISYAAPAKDMNVAKSPKSGFQIYADLEDQVIDPETEAAIYDCLILYAKGDQNEKNFSRFMKCLSDYVDFDTLKRYIYS